MSRDLPQRPEPLPAPTTDAHTHLLSTQEFSGLPVAELIERAAEVGVHRLVEVGCDLPSSRGAIEIAQNHPAVVACVAIHPNDAARAGDRLPAELDALEALVADEHVRGIGETGLDYYRTRDDEGKRLQKHSFAAHLAWAREHDLAVVVHDRDAHADSAAGYRSTISRASSIRTGTVRSVTRSTPPSSAATDRSAISWTRPLCGEPAGVSA